MSSASAGAALPPAKKDGSAPCTDATDGNAVIRSTRSGYVKRSVVYLWRPVADCKSALRLTAGSGSLSN